MPPKAVTVTNSVLGKLYGHRTCHPMVTMIMDGRKSMRDTDATAGDVGDTEGKQLKGGGGQDDSYANYISK